jgi:hypothetical protein
MRLEPLGGPTFDVLGLLHEPGRPASVATVSGRGRPALATFQPPADVRQVRMTGPARLEERDHTRVRRLYDRYVGAWTPRWERQATADSYRLWSMSPDRGMAVAYPGLEDGPTFRWSQRSGLFGPGG